MRLISRRIRIRARVNRRLGRPRRIRVKLAQRINQPPAPNPVIRLIGRIKPRLVQPPRPAPPLPWIKGFRINRSEEHTSELQSLMRISYAVFCLKKKNVDYIKIKSGECDGSATTKNEGQDSLTAHSTRSQSTQRTVDK